MPEFFTFSYDGESKMSDLPQLREKIAGLKEELEAVIVAHNYQRPEVQDIADFVGDSLELSRRCTEVDTRTIVFCGVRFMAETAAILSPEKKSVNHSKNSLLPARNWRSKAR